MSKNIRHNKNNVMYEINKTHIIYINTSVIANNYQNKRKVDKDITMLSNDRISIIKLLKNFSFNYNYMSGIYSGLFGWEGLEV